MCHLAYNWSRKKIHSEKINVSCARKYCSIPFIPQIATIISSSIWSVDIKRMYNLHPSYVDWYGQKNRSSVPKGRVSNTFFCKKKHTSHIVITWHLCWFWPYFYDNVDFIINCIRFQENIFLGSVLMRGHSSLRNLRSMIFFYSLKNRDVSVVTSPRSTTCYLRYKLV